MLTADVIIIGGGIVGCSTALWLAERKVRVIVLERGTVGSEQSSRAWGFVRQQGRHFAEIPIAKDAKTLWSNLTQRLGSDATGYQTPGILMLAETEEDEQRVSAAYDDARGNGISSERVPAQRISELIPELAGSWRCALYTSDDGYADPQVSVGSIAKAARQEGANLLEHQTVRRIEVTGGNGVRVTTQDHLIQGGCLVIAAGIGTAHLARQLGANLPIQIIRSNVGRTIQVPIFTRIAAWGPKVAFCPRSDGSFIIGNGYRSGGADYEITIESFRGLRYFLPAYLKNWRQLQLSFGSEFFRAFARVLRSEGGANALPEPRVNESKVLRNFQNFEKLFPHLSGISLQKMWAGRIDLTPDIIPIIDRLELSSPVYVAAGFSGHGFALGPAVGKLLSDWIVDGEPSAEISAFRAARFADGTFSQSGHAL